MRKLALVAVTVLAACSGGGEEQQKEKVQTAAATLEPGLWEITSEITDMQMADEGAPALPVQAGAKTTTQSCITEEQMKQPQAAVFTGSDGNCSYDNFYMSRGRLNATMSCAQPGQSGKIMMSIDGTYSGTSFENDMEMTTFLPGSGDMKVQSKVTGRRIGDSCPAEGAEAGAG